jgi:ABC-type iron transport system FetAB ATPase subunit
VPECESAIGTILLVVHARLASRNVGQIIAQGFGILIFSSLFLGQNVSRLAQVKLLGEKLSDAVLRIIKWAPRHRASDKTGVTASFHEVDLECGVVHSRFANFIEDFSGQHRIISRAE